MERNRRGNEVRFWQKVDRRGEDECWPWLAGVNPKGYGLFNVEDPSSPSGMSSQRAHRYAWEQVNGPIPPGLVVDHTCFNRACQNVRHLRLLSRSESGRSENKRPVESCRRAGHPYTPDNTLFTKTGARVCKTCRRERGRENSRRYRARKGS